MFKIAFLYMCILIIGVFPVNVGMLIVWYGIESILIGGRFRICANSGIIILIVCLWV